MDQFNVITIIIAGITTGGLTCFAVQGGLLTSIIAQSKKLDESSNKKKNDILPVFAFILSKITIYTLFGLLLGVFGSFFSISLKVQAWIQIIVGIYMVGVALQLLNVHPFFRYFLIQPPKSLQRLVRKVAKGNDQLTSPALLGVMTLFIPCGTTLAMEALAISTGSPFLGALTMLLFTLSSSWVFFAYGYAASKFNQVMQQYFYKLTATILIILGLMSLNGGLNLLGSPYSFDSLASIFKPSNTVLQASRPKDGKKVILADFDNVQKVNIDVNSSGYTSDTIKLKRGVPVEITLNTKNSYSCANAFTIPNLNIQQILPATGSQTITFTPQKTGQLAYSCSMGMYRGNFEVID
ncbi:MAG: sulfite exporter TauE/SafE family protein [bacterium]|nr:sulfite exporter TauE/SafE family protein [bacterium]